jgi:hypothetical protein
VLATVLIASAVFTTKSRRLFFTKGYFLDFKKEVTGALFYIPACCSFVLIFLFQSRWNATSIAYRVGPDSFGWSDAVIFFRSNQTLSDLKAHVISQLHGTPLYTALNVVHPNGSLSIDQIPSFTQQIESEFLLGAHRTGIPYVLGKYSALLPGKYVENVIIAFLAICMFVMVRLGLTMFWDLKHHRKIITVYACVIGLNANLLSQTLEGGLGQLYITPFVLLALVTMLDDGIQEAEASFALALFTIMSLTSYLDAIFTTLPLFVVLAAYIVVTKRKAILQIMLNRLLIGCVVLSFIPISTSFARLFITPFIHPTAGGWDLGRHPLPSDIFGLTPYLPLGTSHVAGSRTFFYLGFAVLISVIFSLYTLTIIRGPNLFLFGSLLLGYLYLFRSVYFSGLPINDYRLWKYSAYATALLPFILLVGQNLSRPDNLSNHKIKQMGRKMSKQLQKQKVGFKDAKFLRLYLVLVVVGISITSLGWITNWTSSRNFTLEGRQTQFIQQESTKYDFVFVGGLYDAMFTLDGDIHYASSSRGGGYQTNYSTPRRPLMFIAPSNLNCYSLQCLKGTYNVNIGSMMIDHIYRYPGFVAISTGFLSAK